MEPPLTSIVILTRNQLDVTVACVDSITRHTTEPYELVFVDNGSTDGTVEYLRALPGAVVIENSRNLGFGGGCNQGIAAARGARVLLLNNDVVVTAGWLAALHRELDSAPDVGMAGPRSNRVAGVQQVDADAIGYDVESLDGLDAFAARWCGEHAGESEPVSRLVGFCILVEREVLDVIGGFDLRYGLGNFEDDDICLRARVAGYACRVAQDSFIHHVGSRTFSGEGIDYASTMAVNVERFRAAWRMLPSDWDQSGLGYRAEPVIARTTFDPARHYAPIVGQSVDPADRVDLDGRRGTALLVCIDRVDAAASATALEQALRTLGPADDVTVVVRVHPGDERAYAALDRAADTVGDAALPDIVVVELEDANDEPVIRACDVVLTAGRTAWARRALAERLGVGVIGIDDLHRLAGRAAAA